MSISGNLRDLIIEQIGQPDSRLPKTKLASAINAVLELIPPAMHSGDDPDDHMLLTDGWTTCHHTVLLTIAEHLDITPTTKD